MSHEVETRGVCLVLDDDVDDFLLAEAAVLCFSDDADFLSDFLPFPLFFFFDFASFDDFLLLFAGVG